MADNLIQVLEGFSDPAAWRNMNDVLVKAKLIPGPIAVDKAFTNEFVP